MKLLFNLYLASFILLSCQTNPNIIPNKQSNKSITQEPPHNTYYTWLQIGVDKDNESGWYVRSISKENNLCPDVYWGNNKKANKLKLRSNALENFPIKVCELKVPNHIKKLRFTSKKEEINIDDKAKAFLIGDTGCDWQEGKDACENLWQYPRIINQMTEKTKNKTPHIIHLGDYIYRCAYPEDKDKCNKKKKVDSWDVWKKELFLPSKKALDNGAWFFTRGNHEECSRAYKGWYLFLDPRPFDKNMINNCKTNDIHTFTAKFGDLRLASIDSSHAKSSKPVNVSAYKNQLINLNKSAQKNNWKGVWIVSHRPFRAFVPQCNENFCCLDTNLCKNAYTLARKNITLFTAYKEYLKTITQKKTASPFIAAMSGHIHLFDLIKFEDGSLPQLIVGFSGAKPAVQPSFSSTNYVGYEIFGSTVKSQEYLRAKNGYAQFIDGTNIDNIRWCYPEEDNKNQQSKVEFTCKSTLK